MEAASYCEVFKGNEEASSRTSECDWPNGDGAMRCTSWASILLDLLESRAR